MYCISEEKTRWFLDFEVAEPSERKHLSCWYLVSTTNPSIYRAFSSVGIKSCNTSPTPAAIVIPLTSLFLPYPLSRYIFLFPRVSHSLCSSNPPTLIFFSSFPLKAARSNPGTTRRFYAVRLIDTRWIERTRVPNGIPLPRQQRVASKRQIGVISHENPEGNPEN